MSERIVIASGTRKSLFLNLRTICNFEICVQNSAKLKLNILAENYSNCRILTEVDNSAKVEVNWIQLGENEFANDLQFRLMQDAELVFRGATFLRGRAKMEHHYQVWHLGEDSKSSYDFRGCLANEASKNSTMEIFFERGAKRALGQEHERITLLDSARSCCLPVIHCQEADVHGKHGASCGQIELDKLQYLQMRGFSAQDIQRLLVRADLLAVAKHMPQKALRYIQEQLDA